MRTDTTKTKRSRKSRFLEFLFWAAISIATALLLILFSDEVLPTNF